MIRLRAGSSSLVGQVRTANEDSFLVTDDMSVRGDILGIGFDDGDDDAFDAARATVGVLWHF